jgi:hypothetical protein
MSSTPQGQVFIEVCRYIGPTAADEVVRNPRLLTDELQKLIERQNIDCTDINCMKWPVVGLSRWATFKCLMMQSDLRELIPTVYTPNNDGFTIRFVVNYREASKTTASFARMHLAEITPLMVSEYGNANYGEAIYLCTFHCDRWAARSLRLHGDILNRRYWEMGWDAGLQNKMTANFTPQEIAQDIITLTTDDADWWTFFRLSADDYVDTTTTPPDDPWSGERGVIGMSAPWKMPVLAWLDRMAIKCDRVFMYLPNPDRRTSPGGGYRIKVLDIVGGAFDLINAYRTDIIAGSIIDNLNDVNLIGFAGKAKLPNVVSRTMRPNRLVLNHRKDMPGSGLAPPVFGQVSDNSLSLPSGKFIGSMPDPFGNVPIQSWKVFSPTAGKDGEAGISFVNADYWRSTTTVAGNNVYPEETPETDVAFRWRRKFDAGICDIWLRGWIMPQITGEDLSGTDAWAGCSWVELRLQTDEKGFGFPTTRIYSSVDDWMLGPCEDDRVGDVEGSGLVQTWRGEDGRTRVHVGMPFAIPCMVTIKSATEVSTNVWRYTVVPAFKAEDDETASTFKGGIGIWNGGTEGTFFAYNLAEVNNTSTFAGPGYKLPLVETGFDVLPIGTDRDGVHHDVTVLAHLCMTHQGGSDRVVAYFHMHNPIDGECATQQIIDDNFDGGFYDGGE